MFSSIDKKNRRKNRSRRKLKLQQGTALRLCVNRTPRHIYAQIIDDTSGRSLVSVNTLQSKVVKGLSTFGNIEAAKKVGKELAILALKNNIKSVVFDRGSFFYHGRVKALAQAAREQGLKI